MIPAQIKVNKLAVFLTLLAIAIVVSISNWAFSEIMVCPFNALKEYSLEETAHEAPQTMHLRALIDGSVGCDRVTTELAGQDNMLLKVHCFPGKSNQIDYSFDIPASVNKLYYGYENHVMWTRKNGIADPVSSYWKNKN